MKNNVRHPLWEFDRDLDGRESKQEFPSGPGTFFVPLSDSLDSVRISDQRLDEILADEPVSGIVTDYCDQNPGSPICDDVDSDGVINVNDVCPSTAAGAGVDPVNRCSVMQLCPCEGPYNTNDFWKNHGDDVECISRTGRDFRDSEFIVTSELGQIVSTARNSSCGKKTP